MSKLSARLKNNQAYLMYWAIVCAFCIGVAACSTDALIGPKKGKAQKITGEIEDKLGDAQITGEIEEESGDAQIIGEIEEIEDKLGDAQITGEIEEESGDVEIIGETEE